MGAAQRVLGVCAARMRSVRARRSQAGSRFSLSRLTRAAGLARWRARPLIVVLPSRVCQAQLQRNAYDATGLGIMLVLTNATVIVLGVYQFVVEMYLNIEAAQKAIEPAKKARRGAWGVGGVANAGAPDAEMASGVATQAAPSSPQQTASTVYNDDDGVSQRSYNSEFCDSWLTWLRLSV